MNSNKEEVHQDIAECFPENENFELVYWPAFAIKCLAKGLLSPALSHDSYITTDPAIEKSKIVYRDFLRRLWNLYQSTYPVDAVIGANFGYCSQREFAAALNELGTPYIVLQKENLNAASPVRRDVWHRIYREKRGPFGGSRILVYNELERDLQIAGGILDADKINVVGMPRLDKLHRWRRANAGPAKDHDNPSILFFAFSRDEKLPQIDAVGSSVVGRNWGEFCKRTHRAIIELAYNNPDIQVLIKTKGNGNQDLEVEQTSDGRIPENLKIFSGGDARALITRSHVVVGFNTTGLLEALAIGKPVITPRFGEACDEKMRDYVLDLGEAVEYAYSPQEIIEKSCRHARNPPSIPAELSSPVAQTLRLWLGNDDGLSGQRVQKSVLDEIRRPIG